jgi:Zn-dependent oligopeptidase
VPRDTEDRVVLGFDYPDFNPFMANARNEEARRRYYIAYLNRGTSRNSEILDEIVALRRELASLYDLPSYAHYVTRRRMAGSPQAVLDFLAGVRGAVAEVEARDVEELRRLKAEMTGTLQRRSGGVPEVLSHASDARLVAAGEQPGVRRAFRSGSGAGLARGCPLLRRHR